MEAKEKAKELFDKYFLLTANAIDDNSSWVVVALNKSLAKQCALIAIEEIRDNLPLITDIQNYWVNVKKELEKL